MDLDLSKLVSVTTDGAPAMVGEKKGAASLIIQHCEKAGFNQKIVKLHCIIHQEALCAKSATLVDVMSVVVKSVNAILSGSLKHRQFQALLEEASANYGDLVYFCEVRWLSRGNMLARVFELHVEIGTFLAQKKLPNAALFTDPSWIAQLAFLADLTGHLNCLNRSIQGKDILVTEMSAAIQAFQVKLRLWDSHLSSQKTTHFPFLDTCDAEHVDFGLCVGVVRQLRENFDARFKDMKKCADRFLLLSSPFTMDVDSAPDDLQMDLITLQCNEELKSKWLQLKPLLFVRDHLLPDHTYAAYVEAVKPLVAMFGSSYRCEQLFSKMIGT